MSMLDRIQDGFKYLDKNGLKHLIDLIKNASAVWKGTKAEWNALPAADKKKYDLAVLLDKTLVKAVDRETGNENDVADLTKVFTGTDEEWEALSTTDKTTYALSATTDRKRLHSVDRETGEVTEIADLTRIWRGTKEEWDALTDEERDKWDQAEIETIEPKDMNPFRTLSDIEELSITSNTDYICPHDGFISAQSPTGQDISTYINGQLYGNDSDGSNTRSVHTIPVCKGDVFKYILSAGITGAVIKARWYTNEVSPGPTDTPVLYRSQALDWDNTVTVPVEQINAGYTCPGDGLICTGVCGGVNGTYTVITVNGVEIFKAFRNSNNTYFAGSYGVVPVSKGDIVKATYNDAAQTRFVPYKDYPDYSTEEHWTGRRWIDGKKIYSKVLTAGENKHITSAGTCLGFTDVMNTMPIEKLFRPSMSDFYSSEVIVFAGRPGNYSIGIIAPGAGITIVTGSHIVIEYTKTTD